MLYSQIVLKKGMPFDLRLPSSKPLDIDTMTREQIDAELQKGIDSIKAGKVYSADEVDEAEEKVTVVRIFYGGRDIEGIINANKE